MAVLNVGTDDLGTAVAQVLSCEGVAGCEGGLFHSGDVDVNVSN